MLECGDCGVERPAVKLAKCSHSSLSLCMDFRANAWYNTGALNHIVATTFAIAQSSEEDSVNVWQPTSTPGAIPVGGRLFFLQGQMILAQSSVWAFDAYRPLLRRLTTCRHSFLRKPTGLPRLRQQLTANP